MTLREFIEAQDGTDFPFIEERLLVTLPSGETSNILGGYFGFIGGNLISWDGDSYSLDKVYDNYRLFACDSDLDLSSPDHENAHVFKGALCISCLEKIQHLPQ